MFDFMLKEDWNRPSEIFKIITKMPKKFSNDKYFKDYTIVITGKPGPTGKTSLCETFNNAGFKAIELTEMLDMNNLVDFKDDKNHVLVDEEQKVILIVLNKFKIREVY